MALRQQLALIPARRESKGIPGKNWRPLAGYPLVLWSIVAARQAGLDVYVVTDGEEIAHIATEAKAKVISEPPALSADDVGDLPVALHALWGILGAQTPIGTRKRTWQRGSEWAHVAVAWLRPTSPFRPAGAIRSALRLLTDQASSVRSVVPACCHPWKSYVLVDCQHIRPASQRWHNKPRQLMAAAYRAAGWIDVFWAQNAARGSLDGVRIVPLLTPPQLFFDLDTEEEWVEAEMLAKREGWRPGNVK